MKLTFCLLLVIGTCCQLSGYTHTMKLSKTMKNMKGRYDVFINGGRDAIFQFVIGSDQQISLRNKRNAKVTITPSRNIEFKSNNPDDTCLTKLTVLDSSRKMLGAEFETSSFRTSASGPSHCGDYTFKLTVKKSEGNQDQLQLLDRTVWFK